MGCSLRDAPQLARNQSGKRMMRNGVYYTNPAGIFDWVSVMGTNPIRLDGPNHIETNGYEYFVFAAHVHPVSKEFGIAVLVLTPGGKIFAGWCGDTGIVGGIAARVIQVDLKNPDDMKILQLGAFTADVPMTPIRIEVSKPVFAVPPSDNWWEQDEWDGWGNN